MGESDRDRILSSARQALDAHDYEGVVNLVKRLADAGDPEAQFMLGYLYFTDYEYPPDVAYDWLTKAAKQDHADACYHLARSFPLSGFTPPLREAEQVEFLIRAGELGSVRAQYDLGALYATGDWAGPKSESQAVKWYTKAAQQGNPEAQYNLASMILLGEGVPRNTTEGIEWLTRAAEQGNESARRLLAGIYKDGLLGVPKDSAKAQYWDESPAETD